MSTIKGIDVSTFQGVLDWSKVKAAGIKFAILRAGYGRYEVDEAFKANAKAAVAAGIPIGVYWFSYALDAAAAKQEAQKCLETIKGYNVTLPVFFDFEYDTVTYAKKQGVTLGRQAFNDHTVAFCDTIEAAGYRAGVYYNLDYYSRFVDKSRLGKYVQWFAQYNSTAQVSGWDIWQYTSSGSIPGISGRFDMNQADESLLTGGKTYTEGWVKDSKGWWYQYADGTWAKSKWIQYKARWYYIKEDGYMASNQWIMGKTSPYYVGADGAMVTNKTLKIDAEGKLTPAGAFYEKISETPSYYRPTLDKLVSKELLKGTGGNGEDLVISMSEDFARNLVVLDRAGVFG